MPDKPTRSLRRYPADAVCSVEGCGKRPYARGLCNAHYLRDRNFGDPLAERSVRWREVGSYEPGAVCAIENCGQPVRTRGWCQKHYNRWRRHGTPYGNGRTRRPSDVPAAPCRANDCTEPARSQGWCVMHWARVSRHGDPDRKRPDVTQRFEAFLDKTSFTNDERPELGPCWLFKGGLNKGYGVFWDGHKSWAAHRWSYTQAHGEIPDGLTLDHLCRTTNCAQPDHLEPVTQSENSHRAHGRIQRTVILVYTP